MSGNDQDSVSNQQNLARQIGLFAQAFINAVPPASASSSPRALGFSVGTTGTTLLLSNTPRHGVLFHVPHSTAQVLIFPSAIATTPTTTALQGGFIIVGLGSASFPSTVFPNVNCSWSAIGLTGSSIPLTVWEFY